MALLLSRLRTRLFLYTHIQVAVSGSRAEQLLRLKLPNRTRRPLLVRRNRPTQRVWRPVTPTTVLPGKAHDKCVILAPPRGLFSYDDTRIRLLTYAKRVSCFSIVCMPSTVHQLGALLEAYNEVRSKLASSLGPLVAATVVLEQIPASNAWSGTCHNWSPEQKWLPALVHKQED